MYTRAVAMITSRPPTHSASHSKQMGRSCCHGRRPWHSAGETVLGDSAGTARSAGRAAPRNGDAAPPPGPRRPSAAAPSASADASSAVKPSPALGAPASAASGAPSAHAAAAAASARPMLSAEGGAPAPAASQGQPVSPRFRRCPCLSRAEAGRRAEDRACPVCSIGAGEAWVVGGWGTACHARRLGVKRA